MAPSRNLSSLRRGAFGRIALYLSVVTLPPLWMGCASAPDATIPAGNIGTTVTGPAQRVRIDPPLVIARAGDPILIPLAPGQIPDRVEATDAAGVALETRVLVSVTRRPIADSTRLLALDAARWVDGSPDDQHLVLSPDRLRATDRVLVDSARAFLVVEPPGAPGAIVVSGARYPVLLEGADDPSVPDAVAAPTADPGMLRSIWYEHAAARLRADPMQRWRERLMTGTLFEPAPATSDARSLIAGHVERRWRVALARVAEADPETARALVETLATVVSFGDGVSAPLWLTTPAEEQNLRRDLLLATSAEDASQRARAWLATRADAAVWVIDDAGARDIGLDATLSTLGAVVLRGDSGVGWTRTTGVPATMFPMPLRRTIRMVGSAQPDVAAPTTSADAMIHARRGRVLPARVGTVNCDRRVFAVPFPVHPPGMRAGPFFREFSRASLALVATRLDASDLPATDDATPADLDAPSAALLTRAPGPHDSPADGWSLFVECAARVPSRDLLRVWIGRFEAPALVVEIEPSGRVRDMTRVLGDGPSGIERINTRVTQTADGWSCWIDLPPKAIGGSGADRFVQLGIERFAMGRSSWPRPMLPWQTEPGRILVDLSTWSDLGAVGERAGGVPIER